MKSKYLFRGLSNEDEKLINSNIIKPKKHKEWKSFNDMKSDMRYHVKQDKAFGKEDPCISLTSSITVAKYYANNENIKNRVIVIDKAKLKKDKLLNLSTTTLFHEVFLSGEPDDIRKDGYGYKGKEYVYGDIINDFIVLPKWLEEYIYYLRGIKEDHKTMEDIKRFIGSLREEKLRDSDIFKLIILYINDNYSSLEELYQHNKLLIMDATNKAQKVYLKDIEFNLIKENLGHIFEYLDKNSLVIKRRRAIEKILDTYIENKDNFVLDVEKLLPSRSTIMKIFYYEYYVKNKSLKEICDLFINEKFIKGYGPRECCEMIGFLRIATLNRLGNVFKEEYVNIENKYTLYDHMNKIPIEEYKKQLKLANINANYFDLSKCICEHLIIHEDGTTQKIDLSNYSLSNSSLNTENIETYYKEKCEKIS